MHRERIAALLYLALHAAAGLASPAAVYVSPEGADSNPGTLDKPFATLERARDEVRSMNQRGGLPRGGVTVFVRGGVYELARTFELGAEDSGTQATPVVYRAYKREKPTLTGSKRISGFVQHRGRILKADVAAQGLKGVRFRQLFFNGKRQHLARYPNFDPANPHGGGFAYVDGELVSMYTTLPNESWRVVQCKPDDFRNWANPQDGQVYIYPRYNWRSSCVPIASVDKDKRQITLARDVWWRKSHTIRPGDRYYVRGMFEELDAPGEWFLDPRTDTLYLWPPEPIEPATVRAPVVKDLIQIGPDAAWITIRGFTIECCDGNGVTVNKSANCVVAGNVVHGIGGYAGIRIMDGKNCGAVSNDVFDACHQGIEIKGGDPESLTPGGHYADNNYVHHIGAMSGHGCGIVLGGIGLRVSHNLIHDTTRSGIFGGGNDCLIEYNHIRHVNLETEDCGAYYSGGCWHIRGQVIRYNNIHDAFGYGRKAGKWGWGHTACCIYLDDDHSGTHVYGNILARSTLGGVFVHAGRDNVIENNVLVDHSQRQVTYSGHDPKSDVVAGHLKGFQKYQHNPAYAKYPQIAQIDLDKAWRMVGNKFIRNIVYYRDPEAKLYGLWQNDFAEENVFDYNVVFHLGRPPLTGCRRAGEARGPNLLGNADFEEATADGMPRHWRLRDPLPEGAKVAATRDTRFAGKQALKVEATSSQAKPRGIVILSDGVPAVSGETYVLRVRMKAQKTGTLAQLAVQTDKASGKNWRGHVPRTPLHVGKEWQQFELCFRLPGPGEPWHEPEMKSMRARVLCRGDAGVLWVDDASLCAAVMMDEWEAWQSMGFDQHSVVADPLFVDPDKDDYRLRPDSPAFKLGFKRIPVDKIGPYKDAIRAAWPIVEAQGVRELGFPEASSRSHVGSAKARLPAAR